MSAANNHQWMLVAPWYRWRRQITEEHVAATPRATRPIFQKFEAPAFVQSFLKDPQHSLKFIDGTDQYSQASLVNAPLVAAGSLAGRAVTFFRPKNADPPLAAPQRGILTQTSMRKLFLDTHQRHYLVVCELHCDAPGFPRVDPKEACQVGFVVRRRYLKLPSAARTTALPVLTQIIGIEAEIAELDEITPLRAYAAKKRAEKVKRFKDEGSFDGKRAALVARLAELREDLKEWAAENGVQTVNEGWIPTAFDKVGSWQIVEDQPEELIEKTYPLYRLAPNPDLPGHDAEGSTIYFGVVPTSALETDRNGRPRLDSQHVYEIRCFARRHKDDCPRTENTPDCHGELFWSLPTESYRIAPAADLAGTSNFPITIQMPDLRELAAQAATAPAGRFSPVRVVQPQALKPKVDGMSVSGGTLGMSGQICFFAIPLITIIAFFVLNLFLPIVVFIFGLWFLLVFKLCIPPTFEVDAGLQAELDVVGKLGLDVEANATVSAHFSGPPFNLNTALELNAKLTSDIAGYWTSEEGVKRSDADDAVANMANGALIPLHASARNKTEDANAEAPVRQIGPDLLDGMEFEPRETQRWEVR